MTTAEVEVLMLVDGDGNYVASDDAEALLPRYDDVVGRDDANPLPYRVIRVKLTVPLPVVPTLTGIVPADGDATLQVA